MFFSTLPASSWADEAKLDFSGNAQLQSEIGKKIWAAFKSNPTIKLWLVNLI